MSTPAKSRFDHTKDELAEGSKKVDMHKTFKRNNFVPASQVIASVSFLLIFYLDSLNFVALGLQGDVKPAIAQAMPANPSEVAVFSGMPSEHAARTVMIAPRPNKTMQNGEGYLHQWQITWQVCSCLYAIRADSFTLLCPFILDNVDILARRRAPPHSPLPRPP